MPQAGPAGQGLIALRLLGPLLAACDDAGAFTRPPASGRAARGIHALAAASPSAAAARALGR